MAYKFTTGSVRKGDIYFEDDRLGEPTYIDFGMDTITLRPSGAAQLYVEDGKVGIGTTAPDHTLHVKSPGTCHVKIESEAGDEAALKIKSGGQSSAYIWQPGSTSDLRFYINGDDVMHLDSNGNIGIGVTDPDTLLEVAGAAHLSGEIATPSAPADGDGGILYPKTDGKLYWRSNEVSETDLTAGGGGGGISFNGSTANGVVTYGNSSTADVESNLTFDGSTLAVTGDVTLGGVVKAPYALTHDVIADGAVAANDIVVVSGYSGATLKVAKAAPGSLSLCRGPFYVANESASDGATFSVVTSKVVTGVNTSAATNVGDKVWMGTGPGSTTLSLPAATADDAQFSLQIEVGRVIAVDASNGAYILQPPRTNNPLVGRVQSGGAASTLVTGFGTEYAGASCMAAFNGESQADQDQIKFVAVMSSNGKLQITMDESTTGEIFTYWVYV